MKEEQEQRQRGTWRKIWHFLWHDNSVWSWIANIVLAFLIIKFLFLPGLGLVLGTTHPVVAVVSGSMEHDKDFTTWWTGTPCCTGPTCKTQKEIYNSHGIGTTDFGKFLMNNGFNKGDLIILTNGKNASLGDIIVFPAPGLSDPIIHRVIKRNEKINSAGEIELLTYSTKGDHNCGSAPFESGITDQQIIGKAALRIPYLGWIKVGLAETIKRLR